MTKPGNNPGFVVLRLAKIRLVEFPFLMEPTTYFILYVADQARSAAFYGAVLGLEPRLDVPGITEFNLPGGAVLGLMPEEGIKKLLGPKLPDPSSANGVPRAELYLVVQGPAAYHSRALAKGGRELSPLLLRNWQHRTAYSLDPDGHVLAFAETEGASSTS
jgi:catechol 2,3-dioxygenase-like lactoylglutathione lyase family enzyme